VLFTYAGWIGKTEVVEVTFDPSVISYEKLVRHASKRKCVSPVFTRDDAQQKTAAQIVGNGAKRNNDNVRGVKDNKYQLSRTALRHVPMSAIQATRINANVGQAARWLSPKQKELLGQIEAHPKAGWPVLIGVDVRKAWAQAESVAKRLQR
jgi:hypothetical protein